MASVAAPEWAKSESMVEPAGVSCDSHTHCSACSRNTPIWPDGAGRTSSERVVFVSGTATRQGSGRGAVNVHSPARPGPMAA